MGTIKRTLSCTYKRAYDHTVNVLKKTFFSSVLPHPYGSDVDNYLNKIKAQYNTEIETYTLDDILMSKQTGSSSNIFSFSGVKHYSENNIVSNVVDLIPVAAGSSTAISDYYNYVKNKDRFIINDCCSTELYEHI